jgi:hypothetical protein
VAVEGSHREQEGAGDWLNDFVSKPAEIGKLIEIMESPLKREGYLWIRH